MLTKDQKVKKLILEKASHNIQILTAKNLDENVKSNFPNFGNTKEEVRNNLKEYTTTLEEGIVQHSASLFTASELAKFETVLSGSALYGS